MRRFGRFGMFSVIGMTGFAFQTTLIAVLTRVSGWHYAYVVPATAEITVLLSFLWHVRWTWADRPMQGLRALLTRLFHYQVARTAGIVGAYMLTLVIVSSFHLMPEVANTLSVATMSILNFAIADRLIFRAS